MMQGSIRRMVGRAPWVGALTASPLGRRAVRWTPWLLILAAVLIGFGYVYVYGVNMIWWDEWSVPELVSHYRHGTLTLSEMMAQHNEHRMFFPRLLFVGLADATAFNVLPILYLSQIFLLLILALYVLVLRRQFSPQRAIRTAVPIAFLVFSLRQTQNLLSFFQLTFIMVSAGAVLTFWSIHALRTDRWRAPFALAASAATVASFSSLHGLIVLPVGLAQILITPLSRRLKCGLATAWCAVSGADCLMYFHGWHRPAQHPMSFSPTYFFSVVGTAFCSTPAHVVLVGASLCLLALALVLTVAWKRQWQELSFWLAVMAFSLATLTAIALGRSEFGQAQALSSRYATYSLSFVIAVYGMAAYQSRKEPTFARMIGVVLVLCLIVPGVASSLSYGLAEGRMDRENKLHDQYILCTLEQQPDEAISFYPVVQRNVVRRGLAQWIRRLAAILKEEKWSVFADPELCNRFQFPDPALPVAAVASGFHVDSVGISRRTACLDVGWAIDASTREAASRVVVTFDGKPQPTYFGAGRKDVVKAFRDRSLVRSGFLCNIPAHALDAGRHTISLKIQSHDNHRVFETPPTIFDVTPAMVARPTSRAS
jgi:hypothetical protein